MSYILDSLKKSDRERQASQRSDDASLMEDDVDDNRHLRFIFESSSEKQVTGILLKSLAVFIAFLVIIFSLSINVNKIKDIFLSGDELSIIDEIVETRVVENGVVESSAIEDEVLELGVGVNGLADKNHGEKYLPNKGSKFIKNSEKNNVSIDDAFYEKNVTQNMSEGSNAKLGAVIPEVTGLYNQSVAPNKNEIGNLYKNSASLDDKESMVVDQNENESIVVYPSKNNNPFIENEALIKGVPSIFALDRQLQKEIPAIDYGAHIYATDHKSGFVILNGVKIRGGEKMRNGIYVEKVNEDFVVLSYQGVVFSLPAMKSWQP